MWAALAAPQPWLAPYEAARRRLLAARRPGVALAETLNRALDGGDAPVRFVPHEALPPREPYEAFIARTGCVPTRDNLHDAFNALAWMTFPAIKRRLNECQADEIARRGIGPARGAVRDALTVFDENGALWAPPDALREALQARDWHALFVAHRAAWADARLVLFGHALLEKLTLPRKAITAHVLVTPPGIDATAAALSGLAPRALASRPFLPLPVLGVPGWWAANEAPAFYDDREVFRPAHGWARRLQ